MFSLDLTYYVFEPRATDWLGILTHEFLDHPRNIIADEAGWCDFYTKTLYVRVSTPSFFQGLANFFKRFKLTPEQWWANYNDWKITHELSHWAYYCLIRQGKEKRDKTHDFLFEFEYWTKDYTRTSFKAGDWVFVSQRVK